jgi:hypothetical protein
LVEKHIRDAFEDVAFEKVVLHGGGIYWAFDDRQAGAVLGFVGLEALEKAGLVAVVLDGQGLHPCHVAPAPRIRRLVRLELDVVVHRQAVDLVHIEPATLLITVQFPAKTNHYEKLQTI